jgi:hypothetical protein
MNPKDMERIIKSIKRSSDWEDKLKSANNLFHMGPKQFSAAVNQYGKIVEILLGSLFKEIIVVILPKEKKGILAIEAEVGRGKAFGDFGLGQMIRVFSKAKIFNLINETLKDRIFDVERLSNINNFRIDQTHYDEEITRNKVDDIRKDTTDILLKLGLIAKDPDATVTTQKVSSESEAQRQRKEMLKRLLSKIRLGLIEKEMIELNYPLDRGNGWYGDVQAKAEIIGVYLDDKETFTVVVRVLEVLIPVDEEEDAYQSMSTKVREIIESIAPETKQKLKILFFAEYDGSGLEGSAYACLDIKDSLSFC